MSLLVIMARKAYSMYESGPWLCPSPLCHCCWGLTMMATVLLREIHHWHSFHSTWSICTQHSWPQHGFYSIKWIDAVVHSWIIFLSLIQHRECVWFPAKRQREGESVIFLVLWRSGRLERKGGSSSVHRAKEQCTPDAGAAESEQQDSARSNGLPLWIRSRGSRGERKNTSRGGTEDRKEISLCSV